MDSFLTALAALYFEETSKKILDKFFLKYGFKLLESNELKVIYNKEDIFVEIYYYPEDIPNYVLMIGIGFIKSSNGSKDYDCVGLWYALPQNSYDFKDWKFSTQQGLKRNLSHIRKNILEKYAKPLWENPAKLRCLIDAQLNETKSGALEQMRIQNILKAKQAFKAGQYSEAVRIFEQVGVNNLSTVELQMYNIGKRNIQKP